MAFTVTLVGENTPANSSSTIITNTGISVGDLLILDVGIGDDRTITPPSGFESNVIFNVLFGAQRHALYWKIADSSDAAASDFTINFSDTTENMAALSKITGHDATTPIDTYVTGTGTSTAMVTSGLTTTNAGALIFQGVHVEDNNTQSGYSITNDNPSWTELFDSNTPIGNDYALACAYGVKTSAGATGASNITSSASDDYVAYLLAINPATGGGSVDADGDLEISALTTAGSAEVLVEGTSDATLTGVEATGAAKVLVSGVGDASLSNVEGTGAASVVVTGSADSELPGVEGAATGEVLVDATGNQTLSSVESSGSAEVLVEGTSDAQISSVEMAGSGSVSSDEITGSGDLEISALEGSGVAKVLVEGSGAQELSSVEGAGSVEVLIEATGAQEVGQATGTGSAEVLVEGRGDLEIGALETAGNVSISTYEFPGDGVVRKALDVLSEDTNKILGESSLEVKDSGSGTVKSSGVLSVKGSSVGVVR